LGSGKKNARKRRNTSEIETTRSQGNTDLFIYLFSIFLLLFICAYKDWFISPHCPHPLPYHPLRPLPLPPGNTDLNISLIMGIKGRAVVAEM
jgi:hypothetical protein